MADVFCEEDVDDFIPLDCGLELGGIVGVGLIYSTEEPTTTQLQNPTFWEDQFDVSPQRYWNIPDTRGSYPGGTPTEEDGYGKNSIRRTGADHEATVEVEGIELNRDFFDGVNKRKKWHVVFVMNSGLMLYVRDVSIWAKIVVDQNIKTAARWNMSFKWSSFDLPVVLTEPEGIFT